MSVEVPIQGLTKGTHHFVYGQNGTTSNTILYFPPFDININLSNATETGADITLTRSIIVTRARALVTANTKNGNTIISFRDDAADVTGTALTIANAATGESDSGALSVVVVAGSKINFKRDATASSSGSITYLYYVEYEYL